ncbi:MAG: AMP-binding protein, partial [Firmicutes bacterium]|nr:AMP-binding protein [Bacillota bacterium]
MQTSGVNKDGTISSFITHDTVGSLLRRSAARHPGKTAVVFRGRRYTYKEFNAHANCFGDAVVREGIGQGDRVAIMGANSYEYLVAWFGLAKRGITLVPINLMLKGPEAGFIVNHSEARALIIDEILVPAVRDELPNMKSLELLICIGEGPPEGFIGFWDFLARGSKEEPEVDVAPEEIAMLAYTSGTEALPKGVMLSHRALISQYVSSIVDGGLRADDVATVWMPLFHCAQMHCFTTPHVYLG